MFNIPGGVVQHIKIVLPNQIPRIIVMDCVTSFTQTKFTKVLKANES